MSNFFATFFYFFPRIFFFFLKIFRFFFRQFLFFLKKIFRNFKKIFRPAQIFLFLKFSVQKIYSIFFAPHREFFSFFKIIFLKFFPIFCATFFFSCQKNFTKLKIGDQIFFVEIAKTTQQRARGLMFRRNLPKNRGMFFIFEREKIPKFWMKNVNFPLEIIFFSAEKKVVEKISAEICAENCPKISPKMPIKFALELPKNNFRGKIGDEFFLEK